ncbi:MAG: MAPEG family protein [Granulosicoccus sp.]|nr:MAPEG family protein [Granulosicoccus sp.]
MLTPVFASALALLLVVLSFRVLLMRRKLGIGVGNGGNRKLERAIAAHSNFIEYTPIALLLMYFYESGGGSATRVAVLGILLLLGRMIHAYGTSQINENYVFRVTGMVMTFMVIIGLSIQLLISYL